MVSKSMSCERVGTIAALHCRTSIRRLHWLTRPRSKRSREDEELSAKVRTARMTCGPRLSGAREAHFGVF